MKVTTFARTNQQLRAFREAYSHHRLRTAGDYSPIQLWTIGLGLAEGSGDDKNPFAHNYRTVNIHNPPTFIQDCYGIDWDGPVPTGNQSDRVEVPATPCPITQEQLHELKTLVDTLGCCGNLGISLYLRARMFVHTHT